MVSERSPGSVSGSQGVSRSSVADVTDCYEAAVVLSKESPYIYGLADAGEVPETVIYNNNTNISTQDAHIMLAVL